MINALCTAAYTWNAVVKERQLFVDGVDEKLTAAANALPLMLPEAFHDNLTGPESMDPAAFEEMYYQNTRYALGIGLKYVYTLVREGDNFFVCGNSGDERELTEGPEVPFYNPYQEPPPSLYEAWDTDQVTFGEFSDEWGTFRSIFVPMRTAQGTRFISAADMSLELLDAQLTRIVFRSLIIGGVLFVVVWILSFLVIGKTLNPIGRLTSHTKKLAQNNFELDLEGKTELLQLAERSHDEIGGLAQAFTNMATRLEEYIENLRITTAAKERIESELSIAHDIQMSFLKKEFPAFPTRRDVDLFADIDPAKEVGGDLYDYFLLDDDHLFFHVGDVSGKGVPASLFMAVTITLMRRIAQELHANPEEILAQVNDELSRENDNLMFVTLFCAILNLKTGEMVCSTAGHNPPVIMRSRGEAEWLTVPPGPAMGVMEGARYKSVRTTLGPADGILCYSDGVNEAMNLANEEYSNEKLISTVQEHGSEKPRDMVETLIRSVKEHAGEAQQSDDIAILSLQRSGAD
ncbi:PP2C family protein-serine/threonine phosphatase [Gemmatimonadota bacterium]